jgi:hypothetical protein
MMTDSKLRRAAERLSEAIMHDQGGFCLDTLHALNDLCEAAGLPDYVGVTAVTDWEISGDGEENVRFFGAGAHVDADAN